jgi:hypothetical protein
MLTPKRAFFSFGELTDSTKHPEYNAWHQLDHRPENLALEGLYYGERFVCSPDCAQARGTAEPPFQNLHYFTYYLLRQPVAQTLREFFDLGAWTSYMGRGPDLGYVLRHFTGQFLPLKGYANPRVLVSADVLPFRPTRGILLHLWEVLEPASLDARDLLAWYDQVHIPDLLACKGVAGVWTFTADPGQTRSSGLPWSLGRRVHLFFLDEDPLQVVADIRAHAAEWRTAGRLRDNAQSMRNLYYGPLRTIIPWQWDWFE